jgi:hypothetical protein
MLALSPLVPPTRRRSVHRRGTLSPVRPATSSPRVDAEQDRFFLYPIGALASLFTLRILPCPNRVHTHARVRDVDAARGTALPSRLRRPRLCPCRDCVAVLLVLAVVAEPPAITRANPTVAFPTSSETKAPRSRPPRLSTSLPRTSFRLGARASGQVSARVRPHVRTQANTPVCHRGAHLSVPRPRVNSNPRCRPSHRHQASPVLDRDLLFARRRPRRVVCCLYQPSPRRATLFRRRRSALARSHPRESSPALPFQTVHAHVHAHACPRKRAAMPPRTPQSRRHGVRAARSRLPSRHRARPGASSHGRTLVQALDQAIAFALLARVR